VLLLRITLEKKSALILGSNPTGLKASLDLAKSGYQVHLVESSPFLENFGESALPSHQLNVQQLGADSHPNITIWTNTNISRLEGTVGEYKVELRQHPRYVNLDLCTACGECIQVCPVDVPGSTHKAIYLDGQPGCMAIDKLGKSPCANTCPGGIHVQGYIALIAKGRFQEAINLIREAIPFPGICGRVCTHPCEINCRRTEIDSPVAVRLLKRFVSDWELEHTTPEDYRKDGKNPDLGDIKPNKGARVAIVGAGPGGMAVANGLVRKGYPVTVFEKLPVIGGMMAIGIPGYRLPHKVIAREYQHILDLGVEVHLNTTIGPGGEFTLDDLFEKGFGAVCLAIGAHRSQTLDIPGEDFPGVAHGIEVLKMINLSQQFNGDQYSIKLSKILHRGEKTRVAVLGGGNTAMDVSRSLKRLGIKDVTILYRRTRAEMPAMPEEIEDAEEEGVGIEYLVSPTRILGNEAAGVSGLECIRMKLGETDSSGRRRPVPIADSEYVTDVDLVILAIGQTPDLELLDPDHGISITRGNRINVGEVDFLTSRSGVFAVGDAVTRDKMAVIEAIGMGKCAAVSIDAYLKGDKLNKYVVDSRQMPIARRTLTDTERTPVHRTTVPKISSEQRATSFAEVELGFTPEQAILEAQRCLACGPCSECQACVEVCKPGAIIHEQAERIANLEVNAIIYANDSNQPRRVVGSIDKLEIEGIYLILPDDPHSASEVSQAILPLLNPQPGSRESSQDGKYRYPNAHDIFNATLSTLTNQTDRVGVFICQCGSADAGEISKVIDTSWINIQTSTWPGVIHAEVLPFSCSPDGAEIIEAAIKDQNLNRIVIAGCTCCSIDQVCYSCTYQRVRCKNNLKLFTQPERSSALGSNHPDAKFGFVNIREQCSWIHEDNPKAATTKATALIAGAVARVIATPIKFVDGDDERFNIASVVNPTRCRACGTCIEICEFGAPELVDFMDQRASWINPTICQGCGTCAAHCPSGAITAAYSTDEQIDAMLSAILENSEVRIPGD